MNAALIPFIFFIIGLLMVLKGADYLVDGASSAAKRLNISEIVIGLTIVSFGTSAPELIVNVLSSLKHKNEIVLGNIIGSNIFNTLLILGVAGIIYPLTVAKNTVFKEIPFSLLAVVLIFILGNDNFFNPDKINIISALDGVIMLVLFAGFMFYIYRISKETENNTECGSDIKLMSITKSVIFILIGVIGLFLGGKIVVDNAVEIARLFGVSEKLIALTIISGGTSLPELATSAVAAFKKNSDIAIGNIVGSNIFNVFWILGLSAFISPITYDTVFNMDLLVLIGSTVILFLFMFTLCRNKLDRTEAFIFLMLYFVYTFFIIYRK